MTKRTTVTVGGREWVLMKSSTGKLRHIRPDQVDELLMSGFKLCSPPKQKKPAQDEPAPVIPASDGQA